jgi:hypothetical protein
MFAESSMPGKPPISPCFTATCDANPSRPSLIARLYADRRPSPGLSINLSSNNPFRHHATSPGLPSPANLASPASQDRSSSGSRPMSRNPFLSTFEAEFNKEAKKTDIDMSASMRPSPKQASFGTSAAEELFVRLPSRLPLPA